MTGRRHLAIGIALALGVATACTDLSQVAPPAPATVPQATVAAAPLPEVPPTAAPPAPPTLPETTTTVAAPLSGVRVPVSGSATGRSVVLIGDQVLVQASQRGNGLACETLTADGWIVEMAAEKGRFVDFASRVVEERTRAGAKWDAAVLLLGNQYDGDPDAFATQLGATLSSLRDKPVVVLTVASRDDAVEDLNKVITATVDEWPNAVVVDWWDVALNEPAPYLDGGGPELTTQGVKRLVEVIQTALGDAPKNAPGGPACVDEFYTDDSAIIL